MCNPNPALISQGYFIRPAGFSTNPVENLSQLVYGGTVVYNKATAMNSHFTPNPEVVGNTSGDCIPSGIWSIRCLDASAFEKSEMLRIWIRLNEWRRANHPEINEIRVLVDPAQEVSKYSLSRDILHIVLNHKETIPGGHPENFELTPAIGDSTSPGRNVMLLVPVTIGDSRWNGIGVTSSDLFLGSALTRGGYRVSLSHPNFPEGPGASETAGIDIVGISLFEDQFIQVRSWLRHALGSTPEWVAFGGPMVTLSPLPAMAHLPGGNIWIRGEGEAVFPRVLDALRSQDWDRFLHTTGVAVFWPGMMLSCNFDVVNRPDLPVDGDFDFSFVPPPGWKKGIEINLTRGCRRHCIFCSRVQGGAQRIMPLEKVSLMLARMSDEIGDKPDNHAKIVNINDDDILQNPDYAEKVFQCIHETGFHLWGIQTSLSSVIQGDQVLHHVLGILSQRHLYAADPLVWFGTDAFLPARGKRLAKKTPPPEVTEKLLAALDKLGIRHRHYWICSDPRSSWAELVDELLLVCRWWQRFPDFDILPHSPFLIPYPTTPLYAWLSNSPYRPQIRYREILRSPSHCLEYPLIERVETPHEMLNAMLLGRTDGLHPPFLESLGRRDALAGMETAHYFITQEMLRADESRRVLLRKSREKLERMMRDSRFHNHNEKTTPNRRQP